jgi:hypothetical protein
VTARKGCYDTFFTMNVIVQGKLGLKLVIKNRKMSHQGGGESERAEKNSRII